MILDFACRTQIKNNFFIIAEIIKSEENTSDKNE